MSSAVFLVVGLSAEHGCCLGLARSEAPDDVAPEGSVPTMEAVAGAGSSGLQDKEVGMVGQMDAQVVEVRTKKEPPQTSLILEFEHRSLLTCRKQNLYATLKSADNICLSSLELLVIFQSCTYCSFLAIWEADSQAVTAYSG